MPGKLCLTLRRQSWIKIGDAILTIERVTGGTIKVTIEAPKEVKVLRDKVIQRIKENDTAD